MTHSYLNEFNTYNIWINSIKYTYFVSFHMKITKTLCTMYQFKAFYITMKIISRKAVEMTH